MEKFEKFPPGTKDETRDGVRKVEFPQPVDMKKFEGDRIRRSAKDNERDEVVDIDKSFHPSYSGGTNPEDKIPAVPSMREWQKRYPARQEQINSGRRKARKLKDKQKEQVFEEAA